MICTANITEIDTGALGRAITEYVNAGLALGDDLASEEQSRLGAAFEALSAWREPAASFGEAVAALRIAFDEFRMGQEDDGLAKPMLEAALGFLNGANASLRPLPVKRRWTRRAILKVAA